MKVTKSATGKRIVTTDVCRDADPRFNVAVFDPTFRPDAVEVALGYDDDGRDYTLVMTTEEADRLVARLTQSLANARRNRADAAAKLH